MIASDFSVGSGGGARERPVIIAMNSLGLLERVGLEGRKYEKDRERSKRGNTIKVDSSITIEIDFPDDLGKFLIAWVLARLLHHTAEFLDGDVPFKSYVRTNIFLLKPHSN
jgi:hypothetical protein